MTLFSRTWWGQRFLEALERITDEARLARGRSYAGDGRILKWAVTDGRVVAQVRGNVNPYFGVYKEPRYDTTVGLTPIKRDAWRTALAHVAARAGYVTRLLLNEMPDDIEDAFTDAGVHLLPQSERDLRTSCSCPDWGNPCKHVAGVTYRLAAQLDQDPFLLFELRGLSRDALRAELERSPLGRLLASELAPRETPIVPVETYYTDPTREAMPDPQGLSLKEFWTGARRPPETSGQRGPTVPALLIKKQGDYPAFWPKDASFVEAMEELYGRVRSKGLGIR